MLWKDRRCDSICFFSCGPSSLVSKRTNLGLVGSFPCSISLYATFLTQDNKALSPYSKNSALVVESKAPLDLSTSAKVENLSS